MTSEPRMTGGPWSGQHTAYVAQQPSICFHKLLRTGQAMGPMCYCRASPMCWPLGSAGQAVKPLPIPLPMKLEFVGWGMGISVFSTSLSQGICVQPGKEPCGEAEVLKIPQDSCWVGPGRAWGSALPISSLVKRCHRSQPYQVAKAQPECLPWPT